MNIDAKRRRQQRIEQLNPARRSWKEWRRGRMPFKNRLVLKSLISLFIYVLVWSIFQLENTNALHVQRTIQHAMNKSFDYSAISAWYYEHIGDIPSFLPSYNKPAHHRAVMKFISPVSGHIADIDLEQTNIVQLDTSSDRTVITIGRGLVTFVGTSKLNGITVRVRHTDGVESIYSGLETAAVMKNDWLVEKALIGHTSKLSFAVMIDKQYVDPMDVIDID